MLHLRFRQQSYAIRLGWFLFSLLLVGMFCLLSIWQLHRYHFKKDLLAAYQQRLTSAPISFFKLPNNPPEFQRIQVDGLYLHNLTIFMQNQFYHDQMGYEVITPLKILGEKKLLLIDRGWVKTIPFDAMTTLQHITGYIKFINSSQFILGNNITSNQHFPLIVQKVDVEELQELTGQTFYPFLIRLDKDTPHGFIRDWIINTVAPEQHLSYAIQWLVMAILLLIFSSYFCCKRVKHEE